MPYTSTELLHDPVCHNLPRPVQRIFIEAFGNACAQLKPEDDQVLADKVAWHAAKGIYEKNNGTWRRKPP